MEIVAVTRNAPHTPKLIERPSKFMFLPCSLAAELFIPISETFTMPLASGALSG